MKYEIDDEQVNLLLQILGEIPAKFSFNGINLLKSLKKVEEKKDAT